MLEAGTKAPDFELPDQNGEMHKLSDYAGKKVILYFYPKDNTAGCTKQACGFRNVILNLWKKVQLSEILNGLKGKSKEELQTV